MKVTPVKGTNDYLPKEVEIRDYLQQKILEVYLANGFEHIITPVIEDIENLDIDGIVISPGPKSPKDAGVSLEIIDKFKGKIPILGVCLGHQCIGYYFNAVIKKGNEPVHGKIFDITHNNKGLFNNVKNPLRVTRYHSLIVSRENLPDAIEITSETEDKVIMGIKHKEYPIYGVQFHPEAEMTEEGHKILNNFIKITKEFSNENKKC